MAQSGTIKKFFQDKGFGVVTPHDGGEDVFVHVKDNSCLEDCKGGEEVYFDKEWDDRKGKYKGSNVSLKIGGDGGGGGGGGSSEGKSAGKRNQSSRTSRLKRWEKRLPKQQVLKSQEREGKQKDCALVTKVWSHLMNLHKGKGRHPSARQDAHQAAPTRQNMSG